IKGMKPNRKRNFRESVCDGLNMWKFRRLDAGMYKTNDPRITPLLCNLVKIGLKSIKIEMHVGIDKRHIWKLS
ncbi:MAG: hypothetical protein WBA10_17145, partial [Elainellaceae cyanobacterium]